MNLCFFALLIIVLFSATANAIPLSSSSSFHNKSEWIQKYKICTSNQQNDDDTTAVEYSNGKYFLCFSPSLNYAASYETETGTLIWKRENIPTFASFTAGRVHIFEFANLLFFKTVGLNLTSGKILWTNPHAGHECQSSYYPADVFMDSLSLENNGNNLKNESVDNNNNILIISCTVDMVYPIWALDATTGELLWEKSIERRRFSGSGNIVNHVFPAVVDNVIYGFDTLSGKLLWTNNNFPLPPAPSSQFLKENEKILSTSSSAAPGTKNDPIISLINQNFDQNNYLTVPASQLIYNLANCILVSYSRYQYFSLDGGNDDMLHLFAVNPQNGTVILWNASEIPGFSTLKNSRVQFLEVSVDSSSSSEMPSRPVATSVFVSMNTQNQIELRHSRTGQLVIKSETLVSSSSSISKIFNIAVCVPGIIYILVPDMTLYVFQADIQQKSDGTWKFISASVVPSFSSNTNNILQNLVSTGEFTSSILGVGSFDFVNNLVSVELFASSFENFATSNQTIGSLTIPSSSQANGFVSYYSQNLNMNFVGVMIPGSGMFVYGKK